MNCYNGFTPAERNRKLVLGRDAHVKTPSGPCDLCGDPEAPKMQFHDEDYRKPTGPESWRPPSLLALCLPCHSRLHRRFSNPLGWAAYLAHVRRGGYARDLGTGTWKREVRAVEAWLREGGTQPSLAPIRPRELNGDEWWESLSEDVHEAPAWLVAEGFVPHDALTCKVKQPEKAVLTADQKARLEVLRGSLPPADAVTEQIQALLPDASTRARVLDLLADAIDEAHRHNERGWSLTLPGSGRVLRLNLARCEAFNITPYGLAVVVDADRLQPSDLEALGATRVKTEQYPSAGTDHHHATFRGFPDDLTALRPALLAFIARASAPPRKGLWARHHSPEALDYVRRETRRDLACPTNTSSADNPSPHKMTTTPTSSTMHRQ